MLFDYSIDKNKEIEIGLKEIVKECFANIFETFE